MHRVGFIVYPGFQLVCLAASSVFEVADLVLGTRTMRSRSARKRGARSGNRRRHGDERAAGSRVFRQPHSLRRGRTSQCVEGNRGLSAARNGDHASRSHLHGRFHSRPGGTSVEPARDHSLDDGCRAWAALSRYSRRGGSDLRPGRSDWTSAGMTPESIWRWQWSKTITGTRSHGRSHASSCSTSVGREGSRSIRRFWNCRLGRTGSRTRYLCPVQPEKPALAGASLPKRHI